MYSHYLKLSHRQLSDMLEAKLLTVEQYDSILEHSLARKAGQHAERTYAVALNKAGTIMLNSIRFYGGEHFNEPYYFMAEITCDSNFQVLSRFWNRVMQPLGIKMNVFTY